MVKKTAHAPATPATTALDRARVDYTTHTYEHDPAAAQGVGYGLEAAHALGVDPQQVIKTLLAHVEGAGLVGGIVPVTSHLDLKALAQAVGGKRATMATPQQAQRSSGYMVGGISPLGQRKPLPTVVDASANSYATVYVSGGRRGFDLGLAPADLLTLTSGTTAVIASA